MSVKAAIHELLTARKAFADAHREGGRQTFQALVAGVYDGRRPAKATGICVTIERDGGLIERGLSEYPACAQPVVSIDIWARDDTRHRSGAHDVDRVYTAMAAMLMGFRGTVGGLTIHTIATDGEPFDNSERPFAGDDAWYHRYSSSWTVCHDRAVAAANNSTYEVR